jgi:hypothetical protein
MICLPSRTFAHYYLRLKIRPASIRVNSGLAEGILRVGIAMEFVGHGAFGIITKAAWLPYFGVFGIPATLAWRLMPVVGTSDICFGILTLVCPVRIVLLYMTAWGFITACLRPLSGEPMWELIERAANFGVLVFMYPATGLLLLIFSWKVFTEPLRLPVGERIWEFIERGGSYAAPLALLFVKTLRQQPQYVTTSHNRCLKSEPQITLDARARVRCVTVVSIRGIQRLATNCRAGRRSWARWCAFCKTRQLHYTSLLRGVSLESLVTRGLQETNTLRNYKGFS